MLSTAGMVDENSRANNLKRCGIARQAKQSCTGAMMGYILYVTDNYRLLRIMRTIILHTNKALLVSIESLLR